MEQRHFKTVKCPNHSKQTSEVLLTPALDGKHYMGKCFLCGATIIVRKEDVETTDD